MSRLIWLGEAFEVDCCAAVGEPEVVLFEADVGELSGVAVQSSDGAFDHGPLVLVGVVELVGGGQDPGGGEEGMVGV